MSDQPLPHAKEAALAPASCSAWIRCVDSMPSGEGRERWVLIVTSWSLIAVARTDCEQGNKPDCWKVASGGRIGIEDVTHWMLLPALPNSNKKTDL